MNMNNFIVPLLLATVGVGYLSVSQEHGSEAGVLEAPADATTALNTPPPRSSILIDSAYGSYPISRAIADLYAHEPDAMQIQVRQTGVTPGFQTFCRGETQIQGSTRPILQAELDQCAHNHIDLIEVPIAQDGIVFVVANNSRLHDISYEQITRMWNVNRHSDVTLYGPALSTLDASIFNFITWHRQGSMRNDYNQSHSYDSIISDVASNPAAIGLMEYAYFNQHHEGIRALSVEGKQPTDPAYMYLHPMFIYANANLVRQPETLKFLQFYIEHAGAAAQRFGYMPLQSYDPAQARITSATIGSSYNGRYQGQN